MSSDGKSTDYQSLLKHAYTTLEEMQSRLQKMENASREPIAVVGVACRFPNDANSPEAFWDLLLNGVDAITEVPPDRWDVDAYYDPDPDKPGKTYTRWGSFLKNVDLFDADFFRISPREAVGMDPKQRLLLEVAWEALENAGLASKDIIGSLTGVFVGISSHDYLYMRARANDPASLDAYFSTGVSESVTAGRISYFMDLRGPNLSLDTACSSSLVAAHLACQSLRLRECDMALAGGANVLLTPEGTITISRARMVSFDGRCKTFDASADGYVRGEGCGVVVLKRLSDALANGDRVLAVILGSAANQDGRSNGLTAPNGLSQEAVIRAALENAGVRPGEVGYVEAHGTGTSLGDPIELRALQAVYGREHTKESPLYVGSVKTNIGHTEGAAGVAGLIKLVLSLHNKVIPPHLHFREPNPLFPWEQSAIEVPTTPVEWEVPAGSRRIGGLSSFGFSGTNVHMIVAEAPQPEPVVIEKERPYHLLVLSAKKESALKDLARAYSTFLPSHPDLSFADICFTAGAGRTHFAERLALTARSSEEAQALLESWLSGDTPSGLLRGTAFSESAPEAAFLFTGQGSQYTGMGRQLYESQPVFRKTLEQCDEILRPLLGRPLLDVLYPQDEASAAWIDQTAYTQPALFAVEYALAQLWASWGIEPGVVMGHSVGEYVAACLAGIFSLEDGLRLIAARGRLMQSLPAGGAMAAVFSTEEIVREAVAPFQDVISIAAINGPENIVISGDGQTVQKVLNGLAEKGIRSKQLVVSHAFHSPLMDPILEDFAAIAASITYHEPQIPLISNVTGRLVTGSEMSNPEYWQQHLRAPVQFDRSMKALYEHGYRLFLEIGPQPTLLGMGRRCLPDSEGIWLPSLRSGRDDWQQMLESLAGLYTAGMEIDWASFDRDYPRRRVPLPTYPFQRERFWLNLAVKPGRASRAREQSVHTLLDRRLRSPLINGTLYESEFSVSDPAYLTDHRFFGTPLFPATGYLEMALAAAVDAFGASSLALEEVSIQEALVLPEDKTTTVQVAISPLAGGQADFQIFSLEENAGDAWKLHTSGKIRLDTGGEQEQRLNLDEIRSRCTQAVDPAAYYQQITELGAEYGPTFRGVVELWRGDGEALGRLLLPEQVRTSAGDYFIHPALLDAAMQILGAAFPQGDDEQASSNVYVPVGFEQYRLFQPGQEGAWAQAVLRGALPGDAFTADLVLLNESGEPVSRISGLQIRKVRRADIWRMVQRRFDEWLYAVEWQPKQPVQLDSQPDLSGKWLLFTPPGETDSRLAQAVHEAGGKCITVQPGNEYRSTGPDSWQINPDCSEDFQRLLAEVFGDSLADYRGTCYLWSLEDSGPLALDKITTELERSGKGFLHLIQALSARFEKELPPDGARLWLVTRGAQPVNNTAVNLSQSPLWGLASTAAAEHPELRCTRLDLDLLAAPEHAQLVVRELAQAGDEDMIAWRGPERYVARFVHLSRKGTRVEPPANEPFELDLPEHGILDNIRLRPMTRPSPGPGEVEVRVRATGLNFRDVLNALGMYPGPAGPIGTECAGVVVRTGEGVTAFAPGDEVIALGKGAFKSHIIADENLVFPKPPDLTFARAASIPIAFLTAYYGLHDLARIRPGDRVLIHAAAGGVGLAAVQLAQRAGAIVFGTAGSPEKRAFLRSLGVEYVMSSRTLDFADQVMQYTDGQGVDIVLNALADEFIPKSLSVLADGGRFLEIGKRGIWDHRQVRDFNPTLEYYPYDLTEKLLEDPDYARDTMAKLMPEFAAGQLKPLPLHVFDIQEVIEAFRFMAQARHTGKIVVTQDEDLDGGSVVREDGSYLITGGLGGLGLAIAGGLIQRGARHLVLMGRSAPSQTAQGLIDEWENTGAHVLTWQGDVSRETDVAAVLAEIEANMPPLRGVIHAAGVLDDGVLRQQSWPRFEKVFAPKIHGAWHLHNLTQRLPLDFFVLFSSMAPVLSNSGQGNYAAANAFLDALAHYRRAQGLPATSINWGPWSEVGMAAAQQDRERQRWSATGVTLIAPDEGVQVFERLLMKKHTQVSVYPMDWQKLAAQVSANEAAPILREMLQQAAVREESGGAAAGSQILQMLNEAAPDERYELLLEHIREQVTRVLGLPASYSVDPQRGLTDLGMDSLMTVELSNRLKNSLGKPLPTTLAFEYPTAAALTEYLLNEVLSLDTAPEPQTAGETGSRQIDEIAAEVEQMSDDEIEATLLQELDDIGF